MKKPALLFFLTMLSIVVFGQGTREFQIWTDFNPTFNIGEKWQAGGDLGYRFQPDNGTQSAYIRPGVSYQPNRIIRFTIGVANFNKWVSSAYSSVELRSFQYAQVFWPNLGDFRFRHRFGLEQRWFTFYDQDINKYVNRARYYLELLSPEFKVFKLKSPFYLTVNFEILRDLESNELSKLIDHDRFTFGLGNQITPQLKVDIRYKIINFVDPQLNSFIRELEVMRVRVYYRFTSSS